jgi:hypothetical protein
MTTFEETEDGKTPLQVALALLRFRVDANSKDVEVMKEWRRAVDKQAQDNASAIDSLEKAVISVAQDVKGMRTMVLRFAFVVAGSAVGLALTVLGSTGKL